MKNENARHPLDPPDQQKKLARSITSSVHVLLLNPLHPGNVGSVARAMKNMGYRKLVLIAEKDPRCSPKAFWMAQGAPDILENALIYKDLDDALSHFSLTIGTTSRQGNRWRQAFAPEELSGRLKSSWDWGPTALLFGPENRGLSVQELAKCRWVVRIPTHRDCPSMNLSHAVALLCYILLHHHLSFPEKDDAPCPAPSEIRYFLKETEYFLKDIAFLKDDIHPGQRSLNTLETLFIRSAPNQSELRVLWALLRHLKTTHSD